jgi:hypothetical protein
MGWKRSGYSKGFQGAMEISWRKEVRDRKVSEEKR